MDKKLFELLDKQTCRFGTNSVKWDHAEQVFGGKVLPMWVADMDFETAPEIIEALEARVRHGIFGYSYVSDEDRAAIVDWEKNRHGVDIKPEWIIESPGVVDSLVFTLTALFDEGDGIIIQPPVYGPFEGSAKRVKLNVMRAPLIESADGWKMDLDAVEKCLKNGAKGMILCNPHNPVGRMWTIEELTELTALLNRYGAKLICDEIHADFELPGATHHPILSIKGAENAVMLISATKTFNLAALRHSTIIAADKAVRDAINDVKQRFYVSEPSVLSVTAQTAAYRYGGRWLDALNEYLGMNRDYAEKAFDGSNGITVHHMEGTYLLFPDFRALGADQDRLCAAFTKHGIGLNSGLAFGEEGRGFMRVNLATRMANIQTGIDRIMEAVRDL